MKKIILFIISILMATSSYGGGTEKKEKFHTEVKWGVKAGLNLTNLIYQGLASTDYAIQWHAGIYSYISLSDKISFQPELLYTVKGNKILNGPTNSLNYIEIPLQLKYNISKPFAFFGGLYLGILTGASNSFETTTYSNSTTPNYNAGLNTIDIGAIGGLGYQYENGFNLGFKCITGLTNVSKHSYNTPMTNLVFSLYLGWTFK